MELLTCVISIKYHESFQFTLNNEYEYFFYSMEFNLNDEKLNQNSCMCWLHIKTFPRFMNNRYHLSFNLTNSDFDPLFYHFQLSTFIYKLSIFPLTLLSTIFSLFHFFLALSFLFLPHLWNSRHRLIVLLMRHPFYTLKRVSCGKHFHCDAQIFNFFRKDSNFPQMKIFWAFTRFAMTQNQMI